MKTQPFGSYPAFSGLVHTAGTKKKGGVQNKGMAKTAENSKCTNLLPPDTDCGVCSRRSAFTKAYLWERNFFCQIHSLTSFIY